MVLVLVGVVDVDVERTVVRTEVDVVRTNDVERTAVLVDRTVVLVLARPVAELTDPAGPARYQLAAGSPRHSPTVTASYP